MSEIQNNVLDEKCSVLWAKDVFRIMTCDVSRIKIVWKHWRKDSVIWCKSTCCYERSSKKTKNRVTYKIFAHRYGEKIKHHSDCLILTLLFICILFITFTYMSTARNYNFPIINWADHWGVKCSMCSSKIQCLNASPQQFVNELTRRSDI